MADAGTGTTTNVNDAAPLLSSNETNPSETLMRKAQRRKYMIYATIALIIIVVIIIIIVVVVESTDDDESSSSINWEEEFLRGPSAEFAQQNSHLFTGKAHVAATRQNYIYGEDIMNQFEEMGLEADIMNYSDIYLSSYNGSSLVQLNTTNPSQILHEFDLSERPIINDSTSNTTLRNQAWLGYSASGNVTGYLVYVNYGDEKDFDVLMNTLNFDLQNKSVIALVRYGALLRGIKALNAANYGFSGVILFSDPEDYGFVRGDVVPKGPYLPNHGFQRGSSAFINLCFGNPSPTRSDERCDKFVSEILPSIPIIPISYGNAYRLMSQMNGAAVSDNPVTEDWTGGLNISYRIGSVNESDGVMVNLFTATKYGEPTKTISNVRGFIAGTKYKNESIVYGAHRDAWVFGAVDPVSGTTSIIEVARAFSKIIDAGWEPLRNIYFLSWDAEEFELIGSTEYGEQEEEFVQSELVAYFNQDVAVSGPQFGISSDPFMELLAKDCMKKVKQPYTDDGSNETVYSEWAKNRDNLDLGMLGSGSDYTVFVHEYGITSMDSGFRGGYGTYHSMFDSYFVMSKFIDPEYEYLRAAAQVVGLMGFNIANNDIIPFNTYNLYARLYGFVDQISDLAIDYDCTLNNNLTEILTDSIEYYGAKAFGFDESVDELKNLNANERPSDYEELVIKYNFVMRTLGTKFLYDDGLPNRKIFKNLIVAAAIENGYGEQVLPYIGYAVKYECNNQQLLDDAYNITSQALYNAADFLEQHT